MKGFIFKGKKNQSRHDKDDSPSAAAHGKPRSELYTHMPYFYRRFAGGNGIGPLEKRGRISSLEYLPLGTYHVNHFARKNHHGKERCEKRSVLLETEGIHASVAIASSCKDSQPISTFRTESILKIHEFAHSVIPTNIVPPSSFLLCTYTFMPTPACPP